MKRPFVFRTNKGVRYELLLKKPPKCYKAEGLCYDPTESNPKILVNPNQGEKELFNTIIHEVAHAFFWHASEERVTKFANTISRYLYQQGWAKDGKQATKAKPKKKGSRRKKK